MAALPEEESGSKQDDREEGLHVVKCSTGRAILVIAGSGKEESENQKRRENHQEDELGKQEMRKGRKPEP